MSGRFAPVYMIGSVNIIYNRRGAGVRWTPLPQAEAPTEPTGETDNLSPAQPRFLTVGDDDPGVPPKGYARASVGATTCRPRNAIPNLYGRNHISPLIPQNNFFTADKKSPRMRALLRLRY